MKMLVSIVRFGSKNDAHLPRVLADLRAIPIEKDIVLYTNESIDPGEDVEVRAGIPKEGPVYLLSMPRRLFAERTGKYDLYVSIEDDTPIVERNVNAFIEASKQCDDRTVPGFLRWEQWPDKSIHIDTIHRQFSWDPMCVSKRGSWIFAELTNVQNSIVMFTQNHLNVAMSSEFYSQTYDRTRCYGVLERAASQFFEEIGLKRVIPVSHIDDFLFPHLADRFHLYRMGVSQERFYEQVQALKEIAEGEREAVRLIDPCTSLSSSQWDKNFDEFDIEPYAEYLAGSPLDVLWIGASGSDAEKSIVEMGHRVTGIPLDSVVAASAEGIGEKVTSASLSDAQNELVSQKFDLILYVKMLERLPSPVDSLKAMRGLLRDNGKIIATVPNFSRWWFSRGKADAIMNQTGFDKPWQYSETGLHYTTPAIVRKWFQEASLKVSVKYQVSGGRRRRSLISLGLLKNRLSDTMVVVGSKR
jgi:2-polyprenyl-3-methyl-5-hydroxy-6-metoxy-1,4-benzoquinol methylase